MSMKGLFFVCMAAVATSPVFGASLLYQGHGSVRIEAADGMVIYVDPYAGEGYDKQADLILVTHEHRDHNNIDLVKQTEKTVVLRSKDMLIDGKYQTKKVGGIQIEAVPAYNKNHKKEEKIDSHIHDMCHDHDCHCEDGILKSSIIHTLKIALYIFIANTFEGSSMG